MSYALLLGLTFVLAALLVACGLGWQLLRQNGRMLLRLEAVERRLDELAFGGPEGPAGLPLDAAAPEFDLPDLAGQRHTLAESHGQPRLLIFFNPACGFCRELAPKLGTHTGPADTLSHRSPARNGAGHPLPLIITTGAVEANRQFFSEHPVTCPVLLQKDGEVATAYQANGTPCGYLVDAEGKIASELAMGGEAVLALASGKAQSAKQKAEMESGLLGPDAGNGNGREDRFSKRSLAQSKLKRDGLPAGTAAPEFCLPRLDGGELSLSELRGKLVLLVFSSPHCGPCNTLAPKLQKFHRKHPDLELVMVSKGEPSENRAKVKEFALTFPVVLQQQWEVSRQYAMFATPIAYLIDEAGVIMRDVAVGSDAIADLLSLIASQKQSEAVHA